MGTLRDYYRELGISVHSSVAPLPNYWQTTTPCPHSSESFYPTTQSLELKPEVFSPLPIFFGFDSENPCEHIEKFEGFCVQNEDDLLRLFPSSLRDSAMDWFCSLSLRSTRTWAALQKQFFDNYCPIYETHMILQEVSNFYQLDEESFSTCWWRFANLFLSWPLFKGELGPLMHTFYHSLNSKTRQFVDSMSDNDFLSQDADDIWDCFDELAQKPQCCVEIDDFNLTNSYDVVGENLGSSVKNEEGGSDLEKGLKSEGSDELNIQCSPSEHAIYTPAMPFHEKSLELLPIIDQSPTELVHQILSVVDNVLIPIQSPPLQDFPIIELIDFLGVDGFHFASYPCLIDIINSLKIDFVRIMQLVEFKFRRLLSKSRYSKYFVLWNGRVQYLTHSLEWSDMFLGVTLCVDPLYIGEMDE